ncbi:Protein of unknown function [Cotesia congregata]|uniref:Uncharacterized protein n=1 Tax=Cotesia congregata TaxID=51543 RepID=A0A8J2HCY4_COTCN|nr:Protein of unknown function [Cotesia congregata]
MGKRKNKETIEQIVKKLRTDKEQSNDNEGEASSKTHEVDPTQESISSSDSEHELPEQTEDDGKADEAKDDKENEAVLSEEEDLPEELANILGEDPSKLKAFEAPKINTAIEAKLSASAKKRDTFRVEAQNSIGSAVMAVGAVASTLISETESIDPS